MATMLQIIAIWPSVATGRPRDG